MQQDDHPAFTRDDVEVARKDITHAGFFTMARYRLRHRLFGGGWSGWMQRERLERGHSVAVLPYDPYKDTVVLGEQFRVGALDALEGPWMLELVAGMMEPGETPEDVALREAREEAGVEILDMEFMYDYYPSPGGSDEKLHLYCGGVDSNGVGGIKGLPSEHEDIRVQVFSRAEAWQLVQENYVQNAATIMAMQWLQLNYQRLQAKWQ